MFGSSMKVVSIFVTSFVNKAVPCLRITCLPIKQLWSAEGSSHFLPWAVVRKNYKFEMLLLLCGNGDVTYSYRCAVTGDTNIMFNPPVLKCKESQLLLLLIHFLLQCSHVAWRFRHIKVFLRFTSSVFFNYFSYFATIYYIFFLSSLSSFFARFKLL